MAWISYPFRPRRAFMIVAVSVVVLGVAVTAGYWSLPRLVTQDRLREALSVHAANWSGGQLRLPENAEVSLVAGPSVRIENTSFEGALSGADWRLDADSIEASVRLLPLLRGQVEIDTLRLDAPELSLRSRDVSEGTGLSAPRAHLPARSGPWGEVIIKDASVAYEGPDGRRHGFSGIDLRISAEKGSSAVLLSGTLPAMMGRLRVGGRLEDPEAFLAGGGSDAWLKLRGASAAKEPPGTTGQSSTADVPTAAPESRVAAALRQVAAAAGLVDAGPVNVEAYLSATPRALKINDATMSFGRVRAEGELNVALAGDEAPFDQMASVLRGASASWSEASAAIASGEWRDAPVRLGWLAPLELELAARLRDSRIAGREVEARRIRLEARGGHARLELAASGDLGELRSDLALSVESEDDPPRIAARGQFRDIDLGEMGHVVLSLAPPPLVSPPQLPEGTLDADFEAESSGSTLGEMVAAFDGTFTADARDGHLTGTDLILTLESLADGRGIMTEEDGPLIPAAGRTTFKTARADIDFGSGAARLGALRIRGERYAIDMDGEADLEVGEMRAEGQARLHADDADAEQPTDRVVLPFGVGGTLVEPVVAAGVPRRDAEQGTSVSGNGGAE